jgi:hypothetical protein
MDVLIVGGDPAVQEGVLQSVRAAGLDAEACPDVRCASDAAAESPPVALVVHIDHASTGEELRRMALLPGGVIILFHDSDRAGASSRQSFGRAVIAELRLPLERARLIALLNRVVERARITGRDKRPPERPLSP